MKRGDSPRLNPIGEIFAINRALEGRTITCQERKEPCRVSHTVYIHQIFVPPVFAQGHGIGESKVALQAITSSRVVEQAAKSFGESCVHKIVVQLLNWHFGEGEAVRPRWIRENNGTMGVALV